MADSYRPTKPADFDAYWNAVDAELARHPHNATLEHSPLRSTEFSDGYDVRLTSIGSYRIFGFLSIPKGEGPFPVLMHTPRYGSVNHAPHYDETERFVALSLMHRGQRLADQPFAAAYPGLLTLGIDDPQTYIYRSIVADCLRGAEWLLSLPQVDPSRFAVVGDDLAVLTAARRPVTALQYTTVILHRIMEARLRSDAYPVEEINDDLRLSPERESRVANTLSYFDPIHHAPQVKADTVVVAGDDGALNGPEWLTPLVNAIGGKAEIRQASHEGGTDHDWLDAWLAQHLETEARPRIWTVVK